MSARRAVAIGGGTGLPLVLRCLLEAGFDPTAVVTVADDGGSSGELRRELGVLPPGDIRNCLVALAEPGSALASLFQYRFSQGSGLAGHALGNLAIAALADIEGGFAEGVEAAARLLGARGRALPSTLADVRLSGRDAHGIVITGYANDAGTDGPIAEVCMDPEAPTAYDPALDAIGQAEVVVIGPGSLYTSIIPNLLVKGIPEALTKTHAIKIYVCNVMTQVGETDGFTASSHLRALIEHKGNFLDYIVLNNGRVPLRLRARYQLGGAEPVVADISEVEKLGVEAIGVDLVHKTDLVRHHPEKLANIILRLIYLEKTQQEQRRHPKNRQDNDQEHGLSLL